MQEKQMTEEKQIEDLAKDVFESGMLEGDSRSRVVAAELFYKGYRKQSEVVKEFAERLKEKGKSSLGDYFVIGWIDQIAKEMGVKL